jgi:hypothetical protein
MDARRCCLFGGYLCNQEHDVVMVFAWLMYAASLVNVVMMLMHQNKSYSQNNNVGKHRRQNTR